MIKNIIKHSSLHFIGLIILRAFSTLIFIILARSLAPQLFGQLLLLSTIITFVSVLGTFGLTQWYQRQHQMEVSEKFSKLFFSRLFTLAVSIVVTIPFLIVTRSFPLIASVVTIFALIPEAFLTMYDGYYLENKKAYFLPLLQVLKIFAIGLALLIFGASITIEKMAIFYFFGTAIASFIGFPKQIKIITFSNLLSQIKNTLSSSAQYATLIATSYAYSRGDSLIIRYTLSEAALGIYGAAYRYLEGVSLLPSAISQNLFHLTARGKVNIQQVVKLVGINATVGLIISVLLYQSANFLTVTLLGVEYAMAQGVVRILSIVVFFFFINAPLSTYIQSTSLMKRFLPFGISNTILNLFLNLLLVPKYGIIAAAYVMLFTEVSGLAINILFAREKIK